jgi:predicted metal-binding membrane protein
MNTTHPNYLLLQRDVILVSLLALATAAWAIMVWQAAPMASEMTMTSPAMGPRALLFLAMWVLMMVAMMFPTAAPMVLAFHRVQASKYQLTHAFIATWVFVATYLLVWAFAGFVVFGGVLVAEARVVRTSAGTAQLGGLIILAAGIYQLTPLKEVCLAKCRTPIDFITTSWRDGIVGAFHMGLLHGAYCVGCCWLLFVILFPLGMGVEAMALVTFIILAEKTFPWPRLVSYATAVALVLYGALVIVSPQLLPSFQRDGSAAVPAEMQMNMPERNGAPAMR